MFFSRHYRYVCNKTLRGNEDEFAVDRPRVGSSFRIHEGFASVGSVSSSRASPCGGRELADKPKGNDLRAPARRQMRAAISLLEA